MSRGPRTRIAKGIYQDAYGLAAVAGGREKRFPPLTPVAVIQRWRQERAYRRKRRAGPRVQRGTLAADADRYYTEITGVLASWREIRSGIRAWVALYGALQRYRLKPSHVTAARRRWLDQGVKPKTINNRVDNLRAMFHTLGDAETPCDGLTPLEVPKRIPHGVPLTVIQQTYLGLLEGERRGRLRTAKTRARFMILAACGVRPAELMRVEPSDIDLERRLWYTRDAKGGYRPGGHFLHDDLLAGWQVFVAANAWGRFETSAFARTLRAAGWPVGVRPYWMRSTVGIELSERGSDFADVSAYLGHTRPETTRTFYVPILGSRMQAAGERLAGRIAWHSIMAPGETAPKP